jgi:hypothetical protein
MKNFIVVRLLAIFWILNSCTKQSITEEVANQPPTGINGDWTLTKITGGFAGINENFSGTVHYNFNSSNNVLTVNNNAVGTSIVNKGLLTGSYPFSISGIDEININSLKSKFTITENTLFIDENVVADGFGYTFERMLNCGTPEPCTTFNHALVLSATVPINGIVNNPIQIQITFSINNGCGGFGNITQTNVANTKTLTVNAKYSGCICTQVMGEIPTTFNFTPTTTGIQIIKIAQPDGSFLTYNVNITN